MIYLVAMTMAATESATPSWMVQLGIAVPFVTALGFMGRWLLQRLDRVEKEKSALYDKIIDDVVPALKAGSDLTEKMVDQQHELATTRAAYVERLEQTVQLQNELQRKTEELHQQELRVARKESR